MLLTLENRGCVAHPRFVLMNSFGQVYCDERHEFVEKNGTLFHRVNDATMKMREILLAEYGGEPVRKFTAPIFLELYTREKVSKPVIEDWCLQATRLILHADQHGMGPVNSSLGLVSVDWGKLEELKPQEGDQ